LHVGCGFFPDDYFDMFSNQFDCMQVRLIGPNLGFAKGMLLKKSGIRRIQIPPSMIKARKSETCNEDYVALIIKNVFPSEENKQLGRFLDPEEDARKSWASDYKKPLSDMYQRMLIGFGVKESVVKDYAQSAKKAKMLKHGEGSRRSDIPYSIQLFFLAFCKSTFLSSSLKGVCRSYWVSSREQSVHIWLYQRLQQ
jgi:hypothetical protein